MNNIGKGNAQRGPPTLPVLHVDAIVFYKGSRKRMFFFGGPTTKSHADILNIDANAAMILTL